MGQLAKPGELTRLELPSSKDKPEAERDWVVFKDGVLTAGDMAGITQEVQGISFMYPIVTARIVEWSFTKDDGEREDITEENVRRMNPEDFTFLMQRVTGDQGGLSDQNLTPSSDTSQPRAINVQ
jgi:hypothetical protein